jgi:hypothetical protein
MFPVYIPNTPGIGTLDVDSDGNVFIGGVSGNTGVIWCVRSRDAKNAAVEPTFDQSTPVDLGGHIVGSSPINPVGMLGQVFLAVDRSGTATNNSIYMLASVRPPGSSGSDVMFARSSDGGQTFSTPRRINDDAASPQTWHWFGAMAVAPNGRIDAVWLDTRNAANNIDSQLFYSWSRDGGTTWSPNVAVSQPFNPHLGYPNQNKMGDYITIVSDNGGGNVAYCATFNGEQDIYYVRVAPSAPVPQSAASRKIHGTAGAFDLPLPLAGTPGVECRLGSGQAFDQHQMIVTFESPVTVASVSVDSVDGLAAATVAVSGSVVTVELSAVGDAQTITVSLAAVTTGTHSGDVAMRMGVLSGDVNGSGNVSASDIAQVKSASGQTVDLSSYPSDVTANGAVNAADLSLVKSRSGTILPRGDR